MSATVINESVIMSPQDSSPSTPLPPSSSSSNPISTTNTNQSSVAIANTTTQQQQQLEVESVMCDCCTLTEDCTPEYITRIRERFGGRWICGLCSEAVKEEIVRSAEKEERLISPEEAVARCRKVRLAAKAEPIEDPTAHLIEALRHMLRRSLDGRGGSRSTPGSPIRRKDEVDGIKMQALARSESCFPTLFS